MNIDNLILVKNNTKFAVASISLIGGCQVFIKNKPNVYDVNTFREIQNASIS